MASVPDGVALTGRSQVWWRCEKGHEWETRLANRFRLDKSITGCPVCSGKKFVKGVNDLTHTHPVLAREWVKAVGRPDVSGPEDVNKASLVRVLWKHTVSGGRVHEWEATVKSRASLGQGCPICAGKSILAGFNDLASQYPEVAELWHPTKNGKVSPTGVAARSSKKYWWLGECGHEWETRISIMTDTRRSSGSSGGCPVCAGKVVIAGVNDLASVASKEVLSLWDYSENIQPPTDFTAVSPRKVWWKCLLGHKWRATIASVAKDGTRCPACAGKVIIPSDTDFGSVFPELLLQWDYEKNTVDPTTLGAGSHQNAWWLCEVGHSWNTSVRARVGCSGRVGTRCPTCSNRITLKGFNDIVTTHPELVNEWSEDNTVQPEELTAGSGVKVWWECKNNHKVYQPVVTRSTWGCPDCLSAGVSRQEKALHEYIEELGFNVISGDRKALGGKELDIYIPEKKIAIEFNGLYWHSEAKGKDKNYHSDKWRACKDRGIQLIQIWEDDWKHRPDVVKSMLAHKLNRYPGEVVFARKTEVQNLSPSQADAFMVKNHIQGSVDGSLRLGLVYEGELVAAMILKNEAGTGGKVLNLLRYATSKSVTGGFTKLLTYVEKHNPIVEQVVTFSDNTVSDGGLYENTGFVAVKQLAPDYMYVVGNQRKHKFGYRLARFRNDPELQYVEGLTEKQLADLNGLARIWDAGKTKWVKSIRR
jgi:DNA-directed RNA polymerase subunit RPC12/RpoP